MLKLRESLKGKERKNNFKSEEISKIPTNEEQFLETFTKDAKAVKYGDWIKFWMKAWLKFNVPMAFTNKDTNDVSQSFPAPCAENVVALLCDYINKVSVSSPHFLIYYFLQMFQNILNRVLMESQIQTVTMPKETKQKTINDWLMEKFNSTLIQLEELFVGTVHNLVPKYESNEIHYVKIIS